MLSSSLMILLLDRGIFDESLTVLAPVLWLRGDLASWFTCSIPDDSRLTSNTQTFYVLSDLTGH